MAIQLEFLNKNMYRKYPIRGTTTGYFNNGLECPQSLFVAAQISTTYTYSKIYISKVYVMNSFLSVVINDYATDIALGSFSALITNDLQVIKMQPYLDTISGSLTVGLKSAMNKLYGANYFDKDNGLLEDCAIFCFTPPAVTKLSCKDISSVGKISLVLDNLRETLASPQLTLSVINTALIKSNFDFNGALDNCKTPLIKKINSVEPDGTGNIDIIGILPISINVASGEVTLTTDLTLDEVCPERVVLYPPTDTSDDYYTDILTATTPEWKTWPQFS